MNKRILRIILASVAVVMVATLATVQLLRIREEEARINSMAACDKHASHPADPERRATPVADDQLALGLARSECEMAVLLNPDSARAKFQLGRAYWLARRDKEAFALFVQSEAGGHVAAAEFIGDAYYLDRGLPTTETPNAEQALEWYRKAFNGGVTSSGEKIAAAETAIRKNRFDPSKFQYPSNMAALYTGNFAQVEAPLALAYYVQGVVKRLDDENTVFQDQKCKPLLNIIGNRVIDYADLIAVIKMAVDGQKKTTEQNLQSAVRGLFDVFIGAKAYRDYGDRDATVLFDKDVYGCDSAVTLKIVSNIMVRLK